LSGSRSYSFGEYTLDLVRGALLKSGVDVKLRPKSFEVLRLLIERNGQLVSKDELLDSVWGRTVVTEGSIAQCLIDVRRAIGDESQKMIRTVRVGVPLRRSVTASDAAPPEHRAGSDGVLTKPAVAASVGGHWNMAERSLAPHPLSTFRLRSLRQGLLAAALISLVPVVIWWGIGCRGTTRSRPVERAVAQPAPQNSIAVLPFVNMSSDRKRIFL
jgi:DNA-binding winged helix-turn-helix (wHTH) protein